jgi:hypothetical protein
MYGSPGIYDAFFLDNQTFSRFRNGFSYPPRTHDLNTSSIQQEKNAWKVPGNRQSLFCEGENCIESVRGVFQRRELLDNDLDNTYNDLKDKPERFQYFYDEMKKDGYLSNPFSENSSLKIRGKKLTPTSVLPEQFPTNAKVDIKFNSKNYSPSTTNSETINTSSPSSIPTEIPATGLYPESDIQGKSLSTTTTSSTQPNLTSLNLSKGTAKLPDLSGRSSLIEGMNLPATKALPNLGVKSSLIEGMSNPEMAVRGADPGTRKVQTPQGEVYVQPGYVDSSEVDKAGKTQTQLKTPLDYNSMFTLGLGALDMGLGYNEDLKNQRILNENIQNRQSKPLYDYNYMYGRTTSGGTEYQPTIKAEMGAHITKRYNSPYGPNNVEVEGGEFIQLPDFSTEYAEGPSHEKGGIKTSLPEGTRVYSDHLKPEGSKKTFAQLAKKYDISSFQKTLDDPFKKQVDKDTATIMLKRNQKKLDNLFNDQQSMNGNSNGEMRDGGINNPGFRALPKAVQDQILANMEYGGYQLPEYATGGDTIDPYEKSKTPQGGITPTGKSNKFSARGQTLKDYLGQWEEYIPGINKMTEGQAQDAIYSWSVKNNPEVIQEMWKEYGNTEKGKNIPAIKNLTKDNMFSEEFLKDPKNLETLKPAYVDNKFGVRQVNPKKKVSETPVTTTTTSETPKKKEEPYLAPKPDPNQFVPTKGVKPGNYNKMNFPLAQAIPNVYGLAESQTIFPYAIPEIDAPYIKPQTLNIQSQLQDIDNMGTAAVRSGADPMTAYIAGVDAKQKAFQTKQNYDAEGRSKADMFNAQGKMQSEQFNANAFNSVYNQMIGQARDAQSAEKQAAIANLVEKNAKHAQSENMKKWYFDNMVTSFDADGNNMNMTLNADGMPTFSFNKPAEKETKTKETKAGKKGMLVSKKKSLNNFKK